MASAQTVPVLYQEVLLSPIVDAADSTIEISSNTNTSLFGSGRKRTFEEIGGHDEESYARKHLASEASIHFRRAEQAPRSILWRVLNDRQTIQLQSVDLLQKEKDIKGESCLTVHIALPAPIIPGGIALADAQQTDGLEVFALTTSNELHTITVERALLARDSTPKDFDATSAIHKHHLSSLSFHHPYKFTAVSATELLISLHDGGFLRLERHSTARNAAWKETFYTEGGWTGTLRGLIPLRRQQTVRFGDMELEPSAAVALATSPDKQHIWTLSLEHELIAWSTQTGKVVARRDLLGARRDVDAKRNAPQYVMSPEQGQLLKIIHNASSDVEMTDGAVATRQYQIIAYSPKERAFKLFFAKAGGDSEEAPALYDILEGRRLTLPFDDLLNTNLWRCTEFECKADEHWQSIQLWVSIQSGTTTRLFTISLDLMSGDVLNDNWEETWQVAWVAVSASSQSRTYETPELSAVDGASPTDAWLRFLLYPGRFTHQSLETALHLYRQKRRLPAPSNRTLSAQPVLEERLAASISSDIVLSKEQQPFQQYYRDLQQQWLGFYSILLGLQSKRLEVMSFAVNTVQELAWVVHADYIGPTRSVDKFERLALNSSLDNDEERYERIYPPIRDSVITNDEDWDHMKMIAALQEFASHLPGVFRQSLAASIAQAVRSRDIDAETFFASTDVGQYVTDEAYQSLETSLQPLNGIGSLANESFTSLINAISGLGNRGKLSDYALTRYGGKFMIASAQQFITEEKTLLLNLIALVTFLNNDFEADVLDEHFDATKVLKEILLKLKHIELRDWLTRSVCLEPSHGQTVQSTIFESLFIGDWDAHTEKKSSIAEKLTHWSRQWAFASFKDWHGFTANIFATLLRHKLLDLAIDFQDFLAESAWTTYLRARLQLALGDHEEASIGFQDAAKGLSEHSSGDLDTAGFLTSQELTYLGKGLELYFLHVADLYYAVRLFANVADFALQSLQHIDESRLDREPEVDTRKKSKKSQAEAISSARLEMQLIKARATWDEATDLRFNALVQTGRYAEAYEALQKFKSPEHQSSNLQKLIDSCVKNDVVEVILELPFDNDTADRADGFLLQLAKKAVASGGGMQPAQQILYAFRTKRGNYRAAAQVLYEHLERLRYHNKKRAFDPEDETLLQAYLILINTMACCGDGEDWLLADPIEGVHSAERRRKLVTLADVRKEYVAELDRRSDLQHGRFPLLGGDEDEMDVL